MASYLFLAGVLLVSVSLLYRAQRRLAQSRQQMYQAWQRSVGRSAPAGEAKSTLGPHDPVARWEVELHQVARQYLGELQTRSAILERQLQEARLLSQRLEKQLEQLQRMSQRVEEPSLAAGQLPSQPPSELGTLLESGIGLSHQAVLEAARQGLSAREIAQQLGCSQGEVELIMQLHAWADSSWVQPPRENS